MSTSQSNDLHRKRWSEETRSESSTSSKDMILEKHAHAHTHMYPEQISLPLALSSPVSCLPERVIWPAEPEGRPTSPGLHNTAAKKPKTSSPRVKSACGDRSSENRHGKLSCVCLLLFFFWLLFLVFWGDFTSRKQQLPPNTALNVTPRRGGVV